MAAVNAIYETLKALRDAQSPADLAPTLYSPGVQESLTRVTRIEQYDEWIKNFMT